MPAIQSTMKNLGSPAPDFALPDTDDRLISLADFDDARGLLVMFLCNHCPYVKHLRSALVSFADDYVARGLAVVAINSNDPEQYPEDSPEAMKLEKAAVGYPFPYLFDESQSVAKEYGAACTPDFFLYDSKRRLVYRGQFDDSRPSNLLPVTGRDLRAAADEVLAGRLPAPDQRPSVGCSIKWRK